MVRFIVRRMTERLDYEAADSELVDDETVETDLRGAIDALDSDCWDNVDERGDEVLLYPADHHQDMRTGEVTGTTVAISGRHVDRLMRYWMKARHGIDS